MRMSVGHGGPARSQIRARSGSCHSNANLNQAEPLKAEPQAGHPAWRVGLNRAGRDKAGGGPGRGGGSEGRRGGTGLEPARVWSTP